MVTQPSSRYWPTSHDPSWSRPTESRILDEISRLGLDVGLIEVDCRRTPCGLILAGPKEAKNLRNVAQLLMDRLGFDYTSTRSWDDGFGAIWVGLQPVFD